MFLKTGQPILNIYERDDDMAVRLEVSRLEDDADAISHATPAFALEFSRRYPEKDEQTFGSTLFAPSDVYNAPLYVSDVLRAKLEKRLLHACFGVVAVAQYYFYNDGADRGVTVLMTIARARGGCHVLSIGDDVAVEFKTMSELRAMLPPFGAEGERGYEDARAHLIAQVEEILPKT